MLIKSVGLISTNKTLSYAHLVQDLPLKNAEFFVRVLGMLINH